MRDLVRLIEALILCGSVGTKFVYGSSVVRPQTVVNGGCPMHEKVPASEPKVQADYFECEWIGSERRDGDGSERVFDNRDHRPAVAVHEEGWAGCIRATGDVDDGARRERLLGEGAYWMLIHIFGREDSAGIGPAGPRSSAGPWAANGESFSDIRFQGGKLRSSSLVDRIPLAWEAVSARVCIRTEWGCPSGPSGAGELVMASSAVSTRSSMGKLATGTGSGLQGTENLWAAVEGLADMVRELKDNEKVENLEGAVKDLAVTISELDGNVRR